MVQLDTNGRGELGKDSFHHQLGALLLQGYALWFEERRTYQRLVNQMFNKQIRRNVEVCNDDMLIKSKEEVDHLDDLKETFNTLRQYSMKLNPSKCAFGVSSGKFLDFMVSRRRIKANPEKVRAILEMSSSKTIKEVQSLIGRVATLNRFVSKATDKCLPFFKTLKRAFV